MARSPGKWRCPTIVDANDEIFLGGYFGIGGWMTYGSGVMRWGNIPDMFEPYAVTDLGVNDLAQLPGTLVMGGRFGNNNFDVVPFIGYTDISTGMPEGPEIPIRTSPNPAINELTIQLAATIGQQATIEVIDASGKIVIAPRPVAGTTMRIDITALAKGAYAVRVRDASRVGGVTFIKD
jgi:hypothetical protein